MEMIDLIFTIFSFHKNARKMQEIVININNVISHSSYQNFAMDLNRYVLNIYSVCYEYRERNIVTLITIFSQVLLSLQLFIHCND